MRFSVINLSFVLYVATAFAARFPIKKISKHPLQPRSGTGSVSTFSPHVLASSSNLSPDKSDLGTINDMIYITNITLGGVNYSVQIDTGSSDLWIKGSTSPLPNTNQTSTTYNLTYGLGWAYGHISYSAVQFAGISVPNQAFLDVSSAQNPTLDYGTNGIIGLGFTSLSTIDALVNKTGSSSGRSLLYNLFSDNPREPNFVAFSLQRSTDPTDDTEGTFLIGELDPDYTAVNESSPIPTFPITSPRRWTVLIEAILVGNSVIPMTTTVPNAPSNRAVALLDSGTSYSYASPEVSNAIYGNIPGAQLDPQIGLWSVPCNVEIDAAIQINGQVFPIHPIDLVPKSTNNPGTCVGSFISQDMSAVAPAANNFDMILGDNVLRSVYSVYDFGDFDTSGNMGAPFVKLLSIVDPNQASKDFAAARGTVARTNITYNAANSTAATSGTTVSLSDDITNTLNKINTYFPIMLAILGLNTVVILLLAIAAFIYLFRRRNVPSARSRRNARPLQLAAMSTDTFAPPPESLQSGTSRHNYQPVSMALTDDTFVPPSPAFHQDGSGGFKVRSLDDRPKSIA
ncbi:acid protease [Lactarius sanguifluus]|nr:acid protease [Lactarius sanguifluus]